MGFHMAGPWPGPVTQVSVWNRTAAKDQGLGEGSTRRMVGQGPGEAAFGGGIRFSASATTRTCGSCFDCAGTQPCAGMDPVSDHTTALRSGSENLRSGARPRAQLIDAADLGGEAGAVNGKLTIMVVRRQAAFDAPSR